MSKTPSKKRAQKASLVPIIVIIFSLISCATTWEGRKYPKKPKGRPPTEQSWPAEKEVRRPEQQEFAAISTPERTASMEIVTTGKRFLERNKFERALNSFQEAVTIDGSNGVAYYYMAKTRYLMEQYEEALGILDKAESLLSSTEEWMEAIAILRTQIRDAEFPDEEEENNLIPIINRPE